MKIINIDNSNEDIFLRCLHNEGEDEEEIIELRKKHYIDLKSRGLIAKLIQNEKDQIV